MSFDNYGIDENTFNHDPQGRPRFYGIYSAQVAAGVDPTGKNRVKVKVFMPSGVETSNWAKACLPITDSSYHPDHKPHIVAELAAMLTTVPTSTADAYGSTDIPALTIVEKAPGNRQLNHQHVAVTKQKTVSKNNATIVANAPTSTTDTKENSLYTADSGLYAPGTTTSMTSVKVPEHTFHRSIPVEGQMVWVVFEAGLLEYPVWIGVQS